MAAGWRQYKPFKTVKEAVMGRSGLSEEELLRPASIDSAELKGLPEAALAIQEAVSRDQHITIVGDYDADGITSSSILSLLLRAEYGANPEVIIPRRFTDGYGFNEDILMRVTSQTIITIDNGITAIGPVLCAEQLGKEVIVIDHHLPGARLPQAKTVFDPHIDPEDNPFVDYCAAGLAFKLCQFILKGRTDINAHTVLRNATALAAIGTITDCMPLISDNRRIVMDGLEIMNKERSTLIPGLRVLLEGACGEGRITSQTIGFTLGPAINAPGRLYDRGGESMMKAVLCENESQALEYTQKILEINDRRKKLVSYWHEVIASHLASQDTVFTSPLMVYESGIPEGLTGILAGRLAEEYRSPAIVLAESREPGVLKGSVRSYGGLPLEQILRSVEDLLIQYGGHENAAGLTLLEDNLGLFRERLGQAWAYPLGEPEVETVYDLDIGEEDVPQMLVELRRYEPYGEGVPEPVFHIAQFSSRTMYGSHYKEMGSNGRHLRLNGPGYSAVGFELTEKYAELGYPQTLELTGTISENTFRGKTTPQLQLHEIAVL